MLSAVRKVKLALIASVAGLFCSMQAHGEAPPAATSAPASDSVCRVERIKAKQGLVFISQGSNQGYLKGKKVCFFDSSDSKAACGVVKSAKTDKSVVKVTKRVKSIKKGFKAALEESILAKAPYDLGLKFYYIPTLVSSVTYNNIKFFPPENPQQEAGTLWQTEAAGAVNFTMGGEIELTEYGLSVGGRYRSFVTFLAEADYDLTNKDLYSQTTISASAFGFWLDYDLLKMGSIRLGIGADIDMSSVDLSTVKKDDTGTEEEATIYTLSSSMTLISLRVPAKWDLYWGLFGISLGGVFHLPLMAMGPTASATADDERNTTAVADPQADLIAQVGHGKNSIGLELLFGAFLGF